jgi:hypothetical protein
MGHQIYKDVNVGHVALMGQEVKICWKILKERDHLQNIGIDERITFK